MASIYIAIGALRDTQLSNTVYSAFDTASGDNNISIGLALMTDDEYYSHYKNEFSDLDVKVKQFDFQSNYGVGKGRRNSRSMYDGQDYFLQIDAHTNFEKDWDRQLVDLFSRSLEKTDNDKTALTAFLGQYVQRDDLSIDIVSNRTRYPVFTNQRWDDRLCISAFSDFEIRQWPLGLATDEVIIPSNKLNAQFVFATQNYVESNAIPDNLLYMEEEVIPSINLLDGGFSLAFPNTDLLLTHLHHDAAHGAGRRERVWELLGLPPGAFEWLMSRNYYDYIYDPMNVDKCKRYEVHAGYSVYPDRLSRPFHIPEEFGY